ncbi:MAG: hypothetical protein K2X38_15820 [Gemmataceae bacterium]|nr:hypothetical protein [Gemmataceae bacterium]
MSDADVKGRPRPSLFRALGKNDPPVRVEVDGETFDRLEIYKHDSWAATSIYGNANGRIICKFNRKQWILFIPMSWLGRWLAYREGWFYRLLADLPCIAPPCGPVSVDGVVQKNAVAHRFVDGHPLGEKEKPSETFFAELEECLAEVHRRGVAYMDLHKHENIVVGDDGRGYLVDFQVSFYAKPHGWNLPGRWLLGGFQAGDRYHLMKHKMKTAEMPREEALALIDRERPWWLRIHRFVAAPLRNLRRKLLVLLGIRKGKGRAQTEHFTEDGLRDHPPADSSERRAA